MFNKDFYPTSEEIFGKLVGYGHLGDTVLEPSAGKGDMVNHILTSRFTDDYSKSSVDCIEKDLELVNFLYGKGYKVIWNDFLTFETYSEYDSIVMNPPFSEGVKHLIKAIKLGENQVSKDCKIYCILNAETIKNPYTNERKELLSLLDKYNAEIEFVGSIFENSERKTNVEAVFIRLKIKSRQEYNFSDMINNILDNSINKSDEKELYELSTTVKDNYLTKNINNIERYLIEYDYAITLLKDSYKKRAEMENYFEYLTKINKNTDYYNSLFEHVIDTNNKFKYENLNEKVEQIRVTFWELALNTDEFEANLTNSGRKEIVKKIKATRSLEFNITNIKMLLTAFVQNAEEMILDSLVDQFEKFTKHGIREYSSNIHYYNGWKTNDSYKIKKKIIYPITYRGFDSYDMGLTYNNNINPKYKDVCYDVTNVLDDLIKAFKLIDKTKNYEFSTISLGEFENEVFKFKMFQKGTIHLWFKDEILLEKFNYICGRKFNWLPTEEELKTDKTAREFIAKEFSTINNTKSLLEPLK